MLRRGQVGTEKTYVDSFREEFSRAGGVSSAVQDDPLGLGSDSLGQTADHLDVPGGGDDVDVEGLDDDVDRGEDEAGVAVAQLGLDVLLQEGGDDERDLGVGQAQRHSILPSVPQQRLLDVLTRGAPEDVVVELPHLLPHGPVQSGGAVLPLLQHGGVDEAGDPGYEGEDVVEDHRLVLYESLHDSKVRPNIRLEDVRFCLGPPRAGASFVFPFRPITILVLSSGQALALGVLGPSDLRLDTLEHGGLGHPGNIRRHELQLLSVQVLHQGAGHDD